MPTFDFTSPDGKSYSVDGPDGATKEQAFQILQQQLGNASPPQVGIGEDLAKSAGSIPGRILASAAGLPADIAHLYATNPNDANPLGSEALKKDLHSYYQAQRLPGQLTQTAGDFLPAVIGGPETLAMKLATRVAAPTLASEAAGAVTDNPWIKAGAGLVGMGAATKAARDFQAMAAARAGEKAIPTAENTLKTASDQFNQARDMNLVVHPEFATNAAADMREALKGFDPEAQSHVFRAADRLEGLGSIPGEAAPIIKPVVQAPKIAEGPIPAIADVPPGPKAQSLLEFLASKGGLGPDSELDAIGGGSHTVNVDGLGRRKLVKQGGWPLDYAREAAEEAGYLHGANGATSTPRDLLDAIDGEIRGQKRYPAGFEGYQTKREATAISEREQHELDRHLQGLHDDLAAAGHGQLGPEVKSLAIDLMAKEGMSADAAVEHALNRLEQEDNAVHAVHAAGFPGDRPMVDAASIKPTPVPAPVKMNDVENIRKQLTFLKMSPDGAIRQAAKTAIKSLQESQMALKPSHVISGDAQTYTKLVKDAVANWAAGKRSNTLMGKAALGELNAATSGSGANQDNALRQAVKQLARPINNDIVPKWKRLGYSDEEGAMIERVARGAPLGNIARYIGKYAPTGVVSTAGTVGLGHLVGGPVTAALPIAGYIAKKIGDLSTRRAIAAADSLVRSRSPLAAEVMAQLPPAIVRQLPAKTQRILQAISIANHASGSQIPQQIGQAIGQTGPQ